MNFESKTGIQATFWAALVLMVAATGFGMAMGWLLRGARAEGIDPKCAAKLDTSQQERDAVRGMLVDSIRDRGRLLAENAVLQTRFDSLTSRATLLFERGEDGPSISGGIALLGSLILGSERSAALSGIVNQLRNLNGEPVGTPKKVDWILPVKIIPIAPGGGSFAWYNQATRSLEGPYTAKSADAGQSQ
jgi:hypothetical protein